MKALIIDDEKHCREVVQCFVQDYCPEIKKMDEATGVSSGLKKIEEFRPDVVFLDIQLNDQTCFDLLDQLDNINFQIIFTTAYDNFAIKAFEYAAVHYLLKPLTPKYFKEAVQRCVSNELTYAVDTLEKVKGFYLETVNNTFNIVYDEITHIEADGSYSTIFGIKGEDIFASKKLGDYTDLLNDDFYRIHHSIIVNMKYVLKVDKKNNLVTLTNGVELPISRRKKSAFKQELEKRG